MSQIIEDDEVNDINDSEYNKILDDAVKLNKTTKQKVLEAARRLEQVE